MITDTDNLPDGRFLWVGRGVSTVVQGFAAPAGAFSP